MSNIKVIYKLDGDSNEYNSEQEAQIAECLANIYAVYISNSDKAKIAKAISEKYFLVPIIKTENIFVTQAELDQKEELGDHT